MDWSYKFQGADAYVVQCLSAQQHVFVGVFNESKEKLKTASYSSPTSVRHRRRLEEREGLHNAIKVLFVQL